MSAAPERPDIPIPHVSDGQDYPRCDICGTGWPCTVSGWMNYALGLEGQRDAAREALRKYGRHSPGCIARPSGATWDDEVICKCGLTTALGEAGRG